MQPSGSLLLDFHGLIFLYAPIFRLLNRNVTTKIVQVFWQEIFYFEKSSEVLMLFWLLHSYYILIVIQMLGFLRMNLSSETSSLPSLFLWNIVWITEQLQIPQDCTLSSTSSPRPIWADRYTAYSDERAQNILWFFLGRKSVRVVLELLTLKAWSVASILILCCSMYIIFSLKFS